MKVINIFGAPGAGKSTLAAGLYSRLSAENRNVELVTEVAKDQVWDRASDLAFDPLQLAARQYHRLHRLREQVDVVVTDSPLVMCLTYLPEDYYPTFGPLVWDLWGSFDNESYYLPLDRERRHIRSGRQHGWGAARSQQGRITRFLGGSGLSYTPFPPSVSLEEARTAIPL